ncbi:deoxyribose-phosphate aldolase [Rhodococcus sp. X156]|uniref:deoxyribose-phosphate aldolase n=1 Tax=Rhodococcus sp. X156 TaxID=2499145 RepID=UPI000FDC6175|nr:deoxyribose-phosphate aldolase [Rhodococcus sp. X156]
MPTAPLTRAGLARLVDHTLLKPEASAAAVRAAAAEAVRLGCASVCVSSARLVDAAPVVRDTGTVLCTVIGFPAGAVLTAGKVAEARAALALGATELDMVADLGRVVDGDLVGVQHDIAAVRAVTPADHVLKVILETAALSDEQVVLACRAAEQAGADFVKTSTGFHPTGGATTEAVRLLHQSVPALGVKASGGIRSLAAAQAMLDAGATRLGMSATAAVLAELPE